MSSYTAVMFRNNDGKYIGKVPVMPDITCENVTRASVLQDLKIAINLKLSTLKSEGLPNPIENWTPVRTVWVKNPRRGDSIPYTVAIEYDGVGIYSAKLTAWPEIQVDASDIDKVISQIGQKVHQAMEKLVAEGKFFPVQDEHDSYIIRV